MICEVMGRYAGWIAMTAGVAGGADVILIPEIDYDIERVIKTFDRRHTRGRSFSIVVISEGAKPKGAAYAELRGEDSTQQAKLGGAGELLAQQIRERTRYEVRVTVLGHTQRGGAPCAFDRELATRFGFKAVDMINEGTFGQVAALRGGKVVSTPIDKAVKKLKRVDPSSDLVQAAKATGVELGA